MDLFGLKKRRRVQELNQLNRAMQRHGLVLIRKDSFKELASLMNLRMDTVSIEELVDLDPWGKRSVDLTGNTAKVIPWKVVDRESGDDIERGEVVDFILDPCLNQSREDFVYEAIGWLMVHGRFLAVKEGGISGALRNIKLLQVPTGGQKLKIQANQAKGLSALREPIQSFLYDSQFILREECVYTYLWSPNPEKRYRGEGLLAAAQYDLGTNVAASKMNHELMKKGGVPPYYMSTVETLSDDEFGQVKTQIYSLIRGTTNIKNVPLLPGGFEIKTVQMSAKEMQLVDIRKHNQEAIATAAGQSIAMLTSGVTTFENQKYAKVLMYESVIKPLLNKVLEAINRDLIREQEPKQKIVANYSVVTALMPDYGKFAAGIPNMLKVMTSEGVNSLAPWDIPEEMQREVQALPIAITEPPKDVVGLLFGKAEKPARTVERKEYWLKRKGDFDSYTREATKLIRKLYRQQAAQVKEYLETLDDDLDSIGHIGQWIPWDTERVKFADRVHRALLGFVKDAGYIAAHALGGDFEITEMHSAKVTEYAALFAKRVNDTTYTQLDEIVRQLLLGERNMAQLLMKATGEDIDVDEAEPEKTNKELLILTVAALYVFAEDIRAPLAGQKESHNAQGYGIIEGGRSAGGEIKEWLSAFLPTSRQEHMNADGQRVGLDGRFIVGGESLEYPGDSYGSVGNTANCNCSVIILKPEGD